MNAKFVGILFFIFFLIIPLSLAQFDCSLTSNQNYCEQIRTSNLTENEKEEFFSALLYTTPSFPNHTFIQSYNEHLIINGILENTQLYNSNIIRNAWVLLLAVYPSVIENNTLFVPSQVNVLSEYNYQINLPNDYTSPRYPSTSQGDCRRISTFETNNAELSVYANNQLVGQGKRVTVNINGDMILRSELVIEVRVRVDHYRWQSSRRSNSCVFSSSEYFSDRLSISDSKNVTYYNVHPLLAANITQQYLGTIKGEFFAQNVSTFIFSLDNASYKQQEKSYRIVFDKKPYYIAYLEANPVPFKTLKNIQIGNSTFYAKNSSRCDLFAYNHFYNASAECVYTPQNINPVEPEEKDLNLSFIFYLLLFCLVIYVIFKLFKGQYKKIAGAFVFVLLVFPSVLAADCGLTDLGSCLPQKMYEYLLVLINSPIIPLLGLIYSLLTAEISIDVFFHVWQIIIYVLNFFYLFFLLYAGFIFLTSSASPLKRAEAKEMLMNTVLMVVFVNASFYLYDLVLLMSKVLSDALLSLIRPEFFLLTVDTISNVGLEILLAGTYMLTLLFTLFLLTIRYVVICVGVLFTPFAVFCYFIPPLRGYGKLILNILGLFIFVTSLDLLILLASSMIVEIPVFANIKILIMISAFSTVNYTFYVAIKYALFHSTGHDLKKDMSEAAGYVALAAGA